MSRSQSSTERTASTASTASTALSVTLPKGIQIKGRVVCDTTEMIDALEKVPKKEQYKIATRCFEFLDEHKERVEEGICALYNFVAAGKLWQGHATEQGFEVMWYNAIRLAERRRRDQEEITRIRGRAAIAWGEENAERFFLMVNTRTMSEVTSKLINTGLTYDDIRLSVNNQVIARLSKRGRGIPRTRGPMQKDFNRAVESQNCAALRSVDLKKNNLQLNQDGFICPQGEGVDLIDYETETEEYVRQNEDKAELSDPSIGSPTGTDYEEEQEDIEMREEIESEDEGLEEIEEEGEPEADIDIYENADNIQRKDPDPMDVDNDEGEDNDEDEAEADIETGEGDNFPAGKQSRQIRMASCGCELTYALTRRIERAGNGTGRRECMQLLRIIGRAVRDKGGIDTDNICARHGREILGAMHMKKGSKSHHDTIIRVRLSYKSLGSWDRFLRERSSWFYRPKTDNSLGVYAYRPASVLPRVGNAHIDVFQYLNDQKLTRRIYGAEQRPVDFPNVAFQRTGSTIWRGLFSWFGSNFDGRHPQGIWPLIDEEFDMYDYHQRENGAPRIGWQRNMWYSLVQQVIRQDPSYYMLYVFSRPDHAYRLISYPYYTKNTREASFKEATEFRHIDINVPDFIETSRGANVLQGSVSLTDEDQDNCTELLMGMHRNGKLARWWSSLSDRGRELTDRGYVNRIQSWMWTPADELEYICNWRKQICARGDVRLSSPLLPHGSTGPSTRVRRTVLPWFVGIQDDHSTLDIAESDTWETLSIAHRDQINAPKTPSGHPSTMYGNIPFRFPASVHIRCPGAISECLIGANRWDHASTIRDLDILFGEDDQQAYDYIVSWRRKVLSQYVQAWEVVKSLERTSYGLNSFFERRRRRLL